MVLCLANTAKADLALTSIDPNDGGGYAKLFDITIQATTVAGTKGTAIVYGPDGDTLDSQWGGFGGDAGTGLSFSLSGLDGLGVQYLSFVSDGKYRYYAKPFKVDGVAVNQGEGAFGEGYNLESGNVALNNGGTTPFYLTGLDSPETIALHFGVTSTGTYTIGVYGAAPDTGDGDTNTGTTPEPATMLIIGLGVAGLGLARRRMSK